MGTEARGQGMARPEYLTYEYLWTGQTGDSGVLRKTFIESRPLQNFVEPTTVLLQQLALLILAWLVCAFSTQLTLEEATF
jgi:hypothetical protein